MRPQRRSLFLFAMLAVSVGAALAMVGPTPAVRAVLSFAGIPNVEPAKTAIAPEVAGAISSPRQESPTLSANDRWYKHGKRVVLSGAGYEPNETVTLHISEKAFASD